MHTVDNRIEKKNYKGKQTSILENINLGKDCILLYNNKINFDKYLRKFKKK